MVKCNTIYNMIPNIVMVILILIFNRINILLFKYDDKIILHYYTYTRGSTLSNGFLKFKNL